VIVPCCQYHIAVAYGLGCGFAASHAESLRLSISSIKNQRLCLGRRSRQQSRGLTESRRLSAREAAKPQS